MAIDMITPEEAVTREIEEAMQREYEVLIETLAYVGESAVAHARSLVSPNVKDFEGRIPPHQPNYIDWTANLRSSIGYVVISEGRVVAGSAFEAIKNGREGSDEGRRFAESLLSKFATGIHLVVVAGMKYASYVSAKGYDVLDSAELLAEKLAKELLERIYENL